MAAIPEARCTYRRHCATSQNHRSGIINDLSKVIGRVKEHVFQYHIVLVFLIEEPAFL